MMYLITCRARLCEAARQRNAWGGFGLLEERSRSPASAPSRLVAAVPLASPISRDSSSRGAWCCPSLRASPEQEDEGFLARPISSCPRLCTDAESPQEGAVKAFNVRSLQGRCEFGGDGGYREAGAMSLGEGSESCPGGGCGCPVLMLTHVTLTRGLLWVMTTS